MPITSQTKADDAATATGVISIGFDFTADTVASNLKQLANALADLNRLVLAYDFFKTVFDSRDLSSAAYKAADALAVGVVTTVMPGVGGAASAIFLQQGGFKGAQQNRIFGDMFRLWDPTGGLLFNAAGLHSNFDTGATNSNLPLPGH